jgi:hypothetical protein
MAATAAPTRRLRHRTFRAAASQNATQNIATFSTSETAIAPKYAPTPVR